MNGIAVNFAGQDNNQFPVAKSWSSINEAFLDVDEWIRKGDKGRSEIFRNDLPGINKIYCKGHDHNIQNRANWISNTCPLIM
jgi:hypothetical protein